MCKLMPNDQDTLIEHSAWLSKRMHGFKYSFTHAHTKIIYIYILISITGQWVV